MNNVQQNASGRIHERIYQSPMEMSNEITCQAEAEVQDTYHWYHYTILHLNEKGQDKSQKYKDI